jgi:hypothetical protein
MRSFLPTGVATAAFIALACAAPVHTRDLEVLQYGMLVTSRRVNKSFSYTDNQCRYTDPARYLLAALY